MVSDNLKWYCVDKGYITMLQRDIDFRVRDAAYVNGIRPYVGVVFQINNFNYYVPVASPKKKYYSMKQGLDIIKIYDTEDGLKKDENSELLCVLNISNMIPVSSDLLKEVNYENISELRDFKSKKDKEDYINLLSKELTLIKLQKDKIFKNATLLYNFVKEGKTSGKLKYVCDFPKLEKALVNHLKNSKI